MTRALLLALALLPLAARAQADADAVVAPTAAAFEGDVALVLRLATAAALVHDRTGTFPADAFAILGSDEGAATGARAASLSRLDVTAPPAEATDAVGAFTFVPLPDPYVRDDEVFRVLVLRRDDGQYGVQYRITRQRDADLGGGGLPYDTAGRFRVESGVGSLCIDPVHTRRIVDAGTFEADPLMLSSEPFTIRVVPPGEDAPVYYQATRAATP